MSRMEAALDILREKGFYIVEHRHGRGVDTNQAEEPYIKVCIDAKRKKLRTLPQLWVQDESKGKVNRKMKSESGKGQRFYVIYCHFEFREENPKTAEQIDQIIENRWDRLYTWAQKLRIK